MKRASTLISLYFISFFIVQVYSQVGITYTFAQINGSYNSFGGGTLLANDVMDNMDDELYGPISIPTFVFDGVAYDKISISSNGFITFGGSLPADPYDYEPISYGEPYNGVVSAFGGDLNYSDLGTNTIRYNTIGSSFCIQWQNVARWIVSDVERISFQIRLDTATNIIHVVYGGTIDPGDEQTYPEVGIRNGTNTFPNMVNNREVFDTTGDWLNSTNGTSELSTCCFDLNFPATVPQAGTIYQWTPIGIDMEAAGLASPGTGGCYDTNETVSIYIRNVSGSTIDFAVNPVTLYANATGPNPTTFTPVLINTGTLAVNASQAVVVAASYDMSMFGTYTFHAYTSMAGDSHSANDIMDTVNRESYTPSFDSITTHYLFCGYDTVNLYGFATAHDYNMTFTNLTHDNIPDDNPTGGFTNIVVPAIAAGVNASQVSVVVHGITHAYDSDFAIYLRAPDLSTIILSDHNLGENYVETYFSDTATTPIGSGFGPFTGSWTPDQAFSNLTGTANGTWRLTCIDDVPADAGVLEGWSILIPVANSIVTYTWTPATGLTSSTIPNPDAHPTTSTTYTLTVTDVSGCTNSAEVAIDVDPNPTVIANSTDTTVCLGQSTQVIGTGCVSYVWNNGVTNGVPFNPSVSDMYVVQGTTLLGCPAEDSIYITVNPLPTVTLNFNPDSLCVNGGLVNLTGGSPAGGIYSGTGVSGSTFDPSIGMGPHAITYNYTDANGCSGSDADAYQVISCAGIEEISWGKILIYPNPNHGNFYLQFENIPENGTLNVYNMLGERIHSEVIQSNPMNVQVNVSAGMYIVEITDGKQMLRKQIVIN